MSKYESLDNDELLFAINNGLPLNKSDYTEIELLKLKEKAAQEKLKRKLNLEKRKQEVLFGGVHE